MSKRLFFEELSFTIKALKLMDCSCIRLKKVIQEMIIGRIRPIIIKREWNELMTSFRFK